MNRPITKVHKIAGYYYVSVTDVDLTLYVNVLCFVCNGVRRRFKVCTAVIASLFTGGVRNSQRRCDYDVVWWTARHHLTVVAVNGLIGR